MRGFPPSPDRRFRCLVMAALLGGASLAGCSGKSTGADPPPATLNSGTTTTKTPSTTTTAATTTTKPPSVEDQVKADYLEAERVYREEGASKAPSRARLARVLWGDQLDLVFAGLERYRTKGIGFEYPGGTIPTPLVLTLKVDSSGDRATLKSCIVDNGIQRDMSTGRVLNDEVVTTVQLVKLRHVDGRWKMTYSDNLERRSGDVGCEK